MEEREKTIIKALETLEAYAMDILDMVAAEKAAILPEGHHQTEVM